MILTCSLMLMSFAVLQNDNDCEMVHEGTFTYTLDNDEKVLVAIKGDDFVEYHSNDSYTVKAKIKWLSECEYKSTLISETLPDMDIPVGTIMHVQINGVEGKIFYYTATLPGESFKGSMKKISDKVDPRFR